MCCRVFSTHLQALCKLHPALIVDQNKELLEFTSTTTNIYTKEDFYTHVVRIIVLDLMECYLALEGLTSVYVVL